MSKIKSLGVPMPDDIANDPIQRDVWANIAPDGNRFKQSDIPTLRLLVYWHAVAITAESAIRGDNGNLEIFDKIGVKPFKEPSGEELPLMRKTPALAILKEASAEIRMLSDMLGITPTKAPMPVEVRTSPNASVLKMVMDSRAERESRAAV